MSDEEYKKQIRTLMEEVLQYIRENINFNTFSAEVDDYETELIGSLSIQNDGILLSRRERIQLGEEIEYLFAQVPDSHKRDGMNCFLSFNDGTPERILLNCPLNIYRHGMMVDFNYVD